MAILVTGGAGFVGSHLVDRLIARGERVVVLDDFNAYYDPARKERNLADAAGSERLTIVRGDIADPRALEAALAAGDIRAVVHMAARAGVRPSLADPHLYERANVGGTLTLLEQCRHIGVTRVVLASSSSVYGKLASVPFSESDPADRPISPYAATKRASELIAHTYAELYGIAVTCLRLFTVYGPRQRPDLAIHDFTRRIVEGLPITLFGNGTSARDYTFVGDIVDGFLAAIDWPDPPRYDVINLGNSHPVSLRTLVELLEETTGRKAILQWADDQPGDVPLTYADISKAGRLLGYVPKVQLREGLARFYDWYVRERQPALSNNGRHR